MAVERPVIGYSGEGYRGGASLVQKSRRAIDALPVTDEVRQEILRAAGDIARVTLQASAAIHALPVTDEVRQEASRVAGDIARGTLQASAAIHNPYHSQEEIQADPMRGFQFGSAGDWETDTKGLEELPGLFSVTPKE